MTAGMETEPVKKLLGNLDALVNAISNKLNQNILNNTLSEKIEEISKFGELENNQISSELKQAKILNIYAYILVSLSFTNLKLNGEKLNNDSLIMNEIKRVKEFMDKVKKAEELMCQSNEDNNLNQIKSKSLINRYLNNGSGHEPAVSKAHFQNNHVRFDNDIESKEVANENENENENSTEIKKVAEKLKKNTDKKDKIKSLKNDVKNNKKESRKTFKSSKVNKGQPKKKK